MAPDCASTFLFAFVRSTTPSMPAAEFLYFSRLPCSRCLCRHAELFSSLLVPLKICCFVQVELWQVLQRRTWGCLGCSASSPAFLLLLLRDQPGGAPSLPSLQLCSEEMILSPKEEEAAQKLCSFLKVEPIDLSHKSSCF